MDEIKTQKEEVNTDRVLVIKHVTNWLIVREMIKLLRINPSPTEALEVIATYHILKAIYKRGIIRSYKHQFSFIAAKCKLTEGVLQDYLEKLHKIELLDIDGHDILLSVYADHITGDREFIYDSGGEERLSQIISAWREKLLNPGMDKNQLQNDDSQK